MPQSSTGRTRKQEATNPPWRLARTLVPCRLQQGFWRFTATRDMHTVRRVSPAIARREVTTSGPRTVRIAATAAAAVAGATADD
jgi:hypothetical protein